MWSAPSLALPIGTDPALGGRPVPVWLGRLRVVLIIFSRSRRVTHTTVRTPVY